MSKKQSQSRRDFMEQGLKLGMGLPLVASGLYSCTANTDEQTEESSQDEKKLNILILGGTSFLGPHQIAYAMSRGHSISTFTRGKTKPSIYQDLFKDVEQLIGDRKDNLTALHDRKWDAVIDNSGRDVEWTRQSASLLKDSCDLYLYTSSTGVFYPYVDSEFKESSPVVLEHPEQVEKMEQLEYDYGIMKANSERIAIEQFGADRTIVVRPTYMIGPADKSNRFIHWPIRLSKGGETMVPGKAEDVVQYIDVRDVAEWMIRLIEQRKAGTYNAVGPQDTQTIHAFVEEASTAFDVDTSLVQIDDYDFLQENEIYYIVPWIMPTGNNAGTAMINNGKAKESGLTFRTVADSVRDTHTWWYSDAVSQEQRDEVENNQEGLLQREQAIIAAWKQR